MTGEPNERGLEGELDSLNNMGVLLPTRGVLVYARGGRPRVELNWQMAETAERIGYDSVWVGDSITSKPRWSRSQSWPPLPHAPTGSRLGPLSC